MNSKALNWQDLRLFLAVAESGSFSSAARELSLGQPTLSRRIAEFEESLDQTLFTRLSHGCELTAAGQKLLPAAQQMAMWSAEAMAQIQTPTTITGCVRVTAPPGIAFVFLAPFAAELKAQYPEIQLEVNSEIGTLNLARGEADISLRTLKPAHDDLICYASYAGEMKVYMSQAKADSLGAVVNIQDLDWICWPDEYDHLPQNQILRRSLPNFIPVFTSNDYNVQIAACQSGLGALALPECSEKSAGTHGLVPIEVNFAEAVTGELHVVVHKRQQHMPRVVKVRELLERYFTDIWGESAMTHSNGL